MESGRHRPTNNVITFSLRYQNFGRFLINSQTNFKKAFTASFISYFYSRSIRRCSKWKINFVHWLDLNPGRLVSQASPVWPDLAIYWTLGNFLKPLVTINFPKSSTFLSNFCKGVEIYNFSSEIIFGQLL